MYPLAEADFRAALKAANKALRDGYNPAPVLSGLYIAPDYSRAWVNRHQALSDHHALGVVKS